MANAVEQSSQSCYAGFLLIGGAIFFLALNVTWLVFQFIWYSGCGIGIFVLTLSAAFLIIFYILSLLLEFDVKLIRPNATLFVVGFSSCYVVYLSWTALASHPDKECNDMIDSGANTAM